MMVDEFDISKDTVQKIFVEDLGEKRKGKKEKKVCLRFVTTHIDCRTEGELICCMSRID